MNPVRELIDGKSPMELVQMRNEGTLTPGSVPVRMSDFEAALSSISPSVSLHDTVRYLEWAKEFGNT